MTSTWPDETFWDELTGKLSEDRTICMQCGAQIGKNVIVCPDCSGDPTAPLPLDCSDFTDDDWETL